MSGTHGRCFFVDNNQATRHTLLTPGLIPFHIYIALKRNGVARNGVGPREVADIYV